MDGPDAYLTALAAFYELSSDVKLEIICQVAVADHGVLLVNRWRGTDDGGGEFEAVFVALSLYRDEWPVGLELFELDDLDAAVARFEELRPRG